MADKSLLVPGTQATTLRDQNGTVYNAVRVSLDNRKLWDNRVVSSDCDMRQAVTPCTCQSEELPTLR